MVGWIDLCKGRKYGEGYVEFCSESQDQSEIPKIEDSYFWKRNYPVFFAIYRPIIKLFNLRTHLMISRKPKTSKILRWDYFFPMSSMGMWNYFFGKSGFHELQFSASDSSLTKAIELIDLVSDENRVFLAGIKMMPDKRNGTLSFNGQKWSIALCFRANKGSISRVRTYINHVLELDGRINLTKDWVMTDDQFTRMYPESKLFHEWRSEQDSTVTSNFALRVGL
jgi:hypothetical protein